MKRIIQLVGLVVLGIIIGGLVWRQASRRRALPCPAWLSWLLENPLLDAAAGAQRTFERAGVAPGQRVLDAGCGPGRLTLPAARRVAPGGMVVAFDMQPAMLERLRAHLAAAGVTNVQPVLGRLGEDALEREAFDRALLVTVLGEIPDRAAALRDLYAALKPGGVLSVTELLPDPHFQSRGTVRRLGTQAGFRVAAVYGSPFRFTMNLVKPG
jgi:ubiquinone/menaquinone biosynthesis C-methylase UbiE